MSVAVDWAVDIVFGSGFFSRSVLRHAECKPRASGMASWRPCDDLGDFGWLGQCAAPPQKNWGVAPAITPHSPRLCRGVSDTRPAVSRDPRAEPGAIRSAAPLLAQPAVLHGFMDRGAASRSSA